VGPSSPPKPPPPPLSTFLAYKCPPASCWCPLVALGKLDRLSPCFPFGFCLSIVLVAAFQHPQAAYVLLPMTFMRCPPLPPPPFLALIALWLKIFCPSELKRTNHTQFLGPFTTPTCTAADQQLWKRHVYRYLTLGEDTLLMHELVEITE